MKVRLSMLDNKTETGFTMSMPSLTKEMPAIEPKLSMPELAQETRKTIYPIRSNICASDIPTMNLSRTLEADLTSREKDLCGYWTESCLEISQKLLSLTETDGVDSDFRYLNILQNKTTANSWFSTTHNSALKKNSLKTLFPSSMFSPAAFMDSGNTLIKSKKIRIYPSHNDIAMFKRYLGLTRYWFNQAVEYLRQDGTKASIIEVRKIQKLERPSWSLECPQRIREHAMFDACEAVKSAKLKFKRTGTFQQVSFRSKKDTKQRFGFDKQSLKDISVFRGSNKISFHSTEVINVEKEGTEIVFENGRWFVVTPVTCNIKKPENQRLGIVALDPGVRTFQTYFNPLVSGDIGRADFVRIFRLCLRMDKIISKMTKADYSGRKRLKKARQRISWKIKDLIAEIHHKTASFLVRCFDTILIPTFAISNMVTKLRSKTARAMLTWSHYKFKDFLKFKAKEYSCEVIEVNEAYTSKTCSFCGTMQNIGSKGVFKCKCGIEVNRDYNGARGIFLKNISLALAATPSLSESLNCISKQLVTSY